MSGHGDWISVKDKVPDSGHDKLVVLTGWSADNRVTIGWYDSLYKSWRSSEGNRSLSVRLWMELPSVPKEDDND